MQGGTMTISRLLRAISLFLGLLMLTAAASPQAHLYPRLVWLGLFATSLAVVMTLMPRAGSRKPSK
jgi:hypothetical protein